MAIEPLVLDGEEGGADLLRDAPQWQRLALHRPQLAEETAVAVEHARGLAGLVGAQPADVRAAAEAAAEPGRAQHGRGAEVQHTAQRRERQREALPLEPRWPRRPGFRWHRYFK